jgi:chemotaxis protein MotB
MRVILILAVASLALGGCVTKKTFEALNKKHTDLTKARDALQTEHDAVKADREAVKGELAATKTTVSEREATIAGLQAEIKQLQEDMAAILKDRSKLKSSVEEMQAALAELEQRKAQVEQRLAEFRSLLDRFKPLMDAGKLKVRIAKGRMVVVLASDILFESGSASLGKEGKETLKEVGVVLAGIPDRSFQIEGHTDDVPIRTERFPSNWELAAARALTVVKTMLEAGMPAARLSAAGFAESQPAFPNDSKEHKAANRRIEIVVVPDLSTLPGFDELQKMANPTP